MTKSRSIGRPDFDIAAMVSPVVVGLSIRTLDGPPTQQRTKKADFACLRARISLRTFQELN